MKVNPKAIVFALELIGAIAFAAVGVIAKHYIPNTTVAEL